MREIKFRGKKVDNDEWVCGKLFKIKESNKWYIIPLNTNIYQGFKINVMQFEVVEIVAETIGQYTGLKDENDIEIYEGDIIECTGDTYTIVWDEVAFKLLCDNDLINQLDDIADISNVIGNIYDKEMK